MATIPESRHDQTHQTDGPDSIGNAAFETEWHRDQVIYCIEALRARFAEYENTYVSGGNSIYYKEGHAERKVSPDCYVVSGVDKHLRDAFRDWEEQEHTFDVVFEFTSNHTRREDAVTKRRIYEHALRVQEYFMFDPQGDYLEPRLQGVRLKNERYERIEMDDLGRLFSEELCVYLWVEDDRMIIADPLSLDPYLTPFELAELAEEEQIRADGAEIREMKATHRAEAEAEARLAAEQHIAGLEAELAQMKALIEAIQKPQSE